MKSILQGCIVTSSFLVFYTLLSCESQKSIEIPYYISNTSLDAVDIRIRDVVKKKDLSIVYYKHIEDSASIYRIFCVKDSLWEKIEIVSGITEIDSIISEYQVDLVSKEIILRKECDKKEGESFFEKIKKKWIV